MKRKLNSIHLFIILILAFNSCKHEAIVSSTSMLPTLNVGEKFEYTKKIENLAYGDLVLVEFEGNDEHLSFGGPAIFRIVGLSGDSISIENDICTINGKKNKSRLIGEVKTEYEQVEEYEETLYNEVKVHIYTSSRMPKGRKMDIEPIKIPQSHYFVMGDYRSDAVDSRYIGTVPLERIIAKITKVYEINQ